MSGWQDRPATARTVPVFLALLALSVGASPVRAQSLGSLFTTLPADFGHLFTRGNAITMGVGGAAGALIYPVDDEIAERIGADGGTTRASFFAPGDALGDTPTQAGIALGAYFGGRIAKNTRLQAAGADLVDGLIVSGTITQILKHSIDRTRPNGSGLSFPSGHSSATFTTAAVIQQHYGWKIAIPFYGLGTYVGLSRMVEREHFASDVILGASIGLVSGRAASFGHGQKRVTVSPALLPGGFGMVGSIGP